MRKSDLFQSASSDAAGPSEPPKKRPAAKPKTGVVAVRAATEHGQDVPTKPTVAVVPKQPVTAEATNGSTADLAVQLPPGQRRKLVASATNGASTSAALSTGEILVQK